MIRLPLPSSVREALVWARIHGAAANVIDLVERHGGQGYVGITSGLQAFHVDTPVSEAEKLLFFAPAEGIAITDVSPVNFRERMLKAIESDVSRELKRQFIQLLHRLIAEGALMERGQSKVRRK